MTRKNRPTDTFRHLQYNWNGERANPPDPNTCDLADAVVELCQIFGVPVPSVCPSTSGGIALEWDFGRVEALLEIHPDGHRGRVNPSQPTPPMNWSRIHGGLWTRSGGHKLEYLKWNDERYRWVLDEATASDALDRLDPPFLWAHEIIEGVASNGGVSAELKGDDIQPSGASANVNITIQWKQTGPLQWTRTDGHVLEWLPPTLEGGQHEWVLDEAAAGSEYDQDKPPFAWAEECILNTGIQPPGTYVKEYVPKGIFEL